MQVVRKHVRSGVLTSVSPAPSVLKSVVMLSLFNVSCNSIYVARSGLLVRVIVRVAVSIGSKNLACFGVNAAKWAIFEILGLSILLEFPCCLRLKRNDESHGLLIQCFSQKV